MSELVPAKRPLLLLCGPASSSTRAEEVLAELDIDVARCASPADLTSHLERFSPDAALLCPTDGAHDAWGAAREALDAMGVPWLGLTHDGAARPGDRVRSTEAHGFVTSSTLDPVLPIWLRPVIDLAARRREVSSLTRTLDWVRSFQRLSGSLEAGHLHPQALDLLMEACGRERGVAVFLRDGPGKGLATALRGFDEAESDVLSVRLVDDKPLDLAVVGGLVVTESGPVHDALAAAGRPCGELLQVPVEGDSGPTGALFIPAGDGRFGELEMSAAEMLLEHMRAALRNAETYVKAKERAFVDDVTDLYNARYLIQTADKEIQRADRYGNPLSVLFLDLDRFKRVNDEWGHLIGSETLRKLSQLLSGCVRQVDTLARYGGDEFTILLVDTDHNAAAHVAERIRHIVEDAVFEVGREARLKLTVSIGVATCPEHATTREALLDAADKAMYRAKSDGRNRVCSAHEL